MMNFGVKVVARKQINPEITKSPKMIFGVGCFSRLQNAAVITIETNILNQMHGNENAMWC